MIAVLVYRPEAAEGGYMNDPDADRLDGVEVLALIDGQPENNVVQDWLVKLHVEHPTWQLSMETVQPVSEFPKIPPPPPRANPDAQFTTLPNGDLRSLDGRIELVHAKPEYLIGWRVKIDGVELDTRLLSPTEAKEHALQAAGLA